MPRPAAASGRRAPPRPTGARRSKSFLQGGQRTKAASPLRSRPASAPRAPTVAATKQRQSMLTVTPSKGVAGGVREEEEASDDDSSTSDWSVGASSHRSQDSLSASDDYYIEERDYFDPQDDDADADALSARARSPKAAANSGPAGGQPIPPPVRDPRQSATPGAVAAVAAAAVDASAAAGAAAGDDDGTGLAAEDLELAWLRAALQSPAAPGVMGSRDIVTPSPAVDGGADPVSERAQAAAMVRVGSSLTELRRASMVDAEAEALDMRMSAGRQRYDRTAQLDILGYRGVPGSEASRVVPSPSAAAHTTPPTPASRRAVKNGRGPPVAVPPASHEAPTARSRWLQDLLKEGAGDCDERLLAPHSFDRMQQEATVSDSDGPRLFPPPSLDRGDMSRHELLRASAASAVGVGGSLSGSPSFNGSAGLNGGSGFSPSSTPVGDRRPNEWGLWTAAALYTRVPALTVSALTVSALTVSTLTVSALTVSALTVSALTVSALTVSALTVSALTVSALTVSTLTVLCSDSLCSDSLCSDSALLGQCSARTVLCSDSALTVRHLAPPRLPRSRRPGACPRRPVGCRSRAAACSMRSARRARWDCGSRASSAAACAVPVAPPTPNRLAPAASRLGRQCCRRRSTCGWMRRRPSPTGGASWIAPNAIA